LPLSNTARPYQLRKDGRAPDYALRAVEVAPKWAVPLDTLGWILVTEGEPAEGLKLLREARARAPQNLLIRYHLAVALSELGRSAEARQELGAILDARPDLEWIDEARALYEALGQG
jgi:Flp pilus assembly protein TadD